MIQPCNHGTQYTPIDFGKRCREAGVRPAVGDCHGNALYESFFATLREAGGLPNAAAPGGDDARGPRRRRGSVAKGDTYEEALENIGDAIRLHVGNHLECGEEVP